MEVPGPMMEEPGGSSQPTMGAATAEGTFTLAPFPVT
jgi:hypothetical protein